VHAVLAARIDRLSPRDKQLLQTAAVIGRDVPVRLLRAIVPRSEAELQSGLATLQQADLLRERPFAAEPEYTFKHALVHDVAYQGLLHDLRRAIHARIVPAIEGAWPDRLSEHVERLAEHAHRGELWDLALRYARQAGARAAARSAHSEAVAWFTRALEALAHLPEDRARHEQAVDVHLSAANSLLPNRELVGMAEHLGQAERQAQEIGDRHRLARVSSFQATNAWLRGHHEQAVEYGRQALEIATEFGDLALAVGTNLVLGETYHALGRYHEAIEVLERNVAVLQGDLETRRVGLVGLPSVLSRIWIGWSLTELGDFAAAGPMGDEAARIAERADHPYSRIVAYFGVGGVHLRRGELEPATAMLERAIALCRVWDTQLRQLFLGVAPSLGHAHARAGRLAEGIALLEDSVQGSAAAGMLYGQALRLSWLADAYLRAGRLVDARRVARQALELARGQRERGHEAWALGVLAEIAAQSASAVDEAEAVYQEALAVAEALGMRPRLALAHLGLGRLYRRTGRRADAARHLAAARELFGVMAMPLGLAQTETEQAALGA
jgi:tetratricopeptide (TPR) repeat protein